MILNTKMKEMGVRWTDPMDYDLVLERNFRLGKSAVQDEKTIVNEVAAAFSTVIVPGGQQYVLPRHVDFFAKTNVKQEKDKKKEIEKKKVRGGEQAKRQGLAFRKCRKMSQRRF